MWPSVGLASLFLGSWNVLTQLHVPPNQLVLGFSNSPGQSTKKSGTSATKDEGHLQKLIAVCALAK